MPVSIGSRCHTFRCSPPPHKDTQPCSIFRLLQCCRSEVNRFRPLCHRQSLTVLFTCAVTLLLLRSTTCSQQSMLDLKSKMRGKVFVCMTCVWNLQERKDLGVGFSSHNSAPMWTKWMMGNQPMNTERYKLA